MRSEALPAHSGSSGRGVQQLGAGLGGSRRGQGRECAGPGAGSRARSLRQRWWRGPTGPEEVVVVETPREDRRGPGRVLGRPCHDRRGRRGRSIRRVPFGPVRGRFLHLPGSSCPLDRLCWCWRVRRPQSRAPARWNSARRLETSDPAVSKAVRAGFTPSRRCASGVRWAYAFARPAARRCTVKGPGVDRIRPLAAFAGRLSKFRSSIP